MAQTDGWGKDSPGESPLTPRRMQDAADYLDMHGDVGSDHFAPYGIGSMSQSDAWAMIKHARSLGWEPEPRAPAPTDIGGPWQPPDGLWNDRRKN